jgi:hypothetical protein
MATVEERIFANRLMTTREEFEAFDQAVQEVASAQKVDLRALVRAFDDSTKHHEVMYGHSSASMVHSSLPV